MKLNFVPTEKYSTFHYYCVIKSFLKCYCLFDVFFQRQKNVSFVANYGSFNSNKIFLFSLKLSQKTFRTDDTNVKIHQIYFYHLFTVISYCLVLVISTNNVKRCILCVLFINLLYSTLYGTFVNCTLYLT